MNNYLSIKHGWIFIKIFTINELTDLISLKDEDYIMHCICQKKVVYKDNKLLTTW